MGFGGPAWIRTSNQQIMSLSSGETSRLCGSTTCRKSLFFQRHSLTLERLRMTLVPSECPYSRTPHGHDTKKQIQEAAMGFHLTQRLVGSLKPQKKSN